MIEKLLTLESIDVNVEAKDWIDAVSYAGNILLKNEKIEERYIKGMIDVVKEMGPYIVMVPGVAMPHARPEAGAKSLGLSVITLKNPVSFGEGEDNSVSVIFALCAKESKTHLELLQDLSYILDEPDIVSMSKACSTKEELIKLLNDFYNKNK